MSLLGCRKWHDVRSQLHRGGCSPRGKGGVGAPLVTSFNSHFNFHTSSSFLIHSLTSADTSPTAAPKAGNSGPEPQP
eukprot:scaffold4733_cov170-Alexandrium_tamarense.AAC.23